MIYEDIDYTKVGIVPESGHEVGLATYRITKAGFELSGSYIAINYKVLTPIKVNVIEEYLMDTLEYIPFIAAVCDAQNVINNRIVELGIYGDPAVSSWINTIANTALDDLVTIILDKSIVDESKKRLKEDLYRKLLNEIKRAKEMLNITD